MAVGRHCQPRQFIVYSPALTVLSKSCLGEGRHVCIYEFIFWVTTNPFCPEAVPTGPVVLAVVPA